MLRWLPLLLALPFVELWLLLKMAERTSGTTTFLMVIGSAIFGGWLAMLQLSGNAERLKAAAQRGEVPAEAVAESTLILVGGFLLVLPGILTDTLGALLLCPPIRRFIASQLARGARFEVHSYTYDRREGGGSGDRREGGGGGPFGRGPFGDTLEDEPDDPNVIDSYVVKRTESLTQDGLPEGPPVGPADGSTDGSRDQRH
jgi:UPF0716 protein FxsA